MSCNPSGSPASSRATTMRWESVTLGRGIERLGLLVHCAERAGGVVVDHRFVWAQQHGEIRSADRVVLASLHGIVRSQKDARPGILRNLPQMSLKGLDGAVPHVAQRFFF